MASMPPLMWRCEIYLRESRSTCSAANRRIEIELEGITKLSLLNGSAIRAVAANNGAIETKGR
jgi:hypothetical protein